MVVVDIRMQKLDGVEVAGALAKYPEAPPVLVCAVETDPKIVDVARRAGTRTYVFNARVEV
jgi:DNA-binding NarL/FixJ family response regulator